ncbi:MAG: hypothetical protein EHM61_16875 [Acidobacteria bacterium]|nr:MAG: hypothetical protein EHM61_16875 [Acidobacteriota bacterium]
MAFLLVMRESISQPMGRKKVLAVTVKHSGCAAIFYVMTIGKLIRLTIQVDVSPENANLREAFEYLKRLKGADRVELTDISIVQDPKAEEKKQRQSMDLNFMPAESPVPPPLLPRIPLKAESGEEEQPPKQEEDPTTLLDRIKIR